MLTHLYGASESGVVSVLAPPRYEANANLATSAGRIVDGVAVRLRRADGLLAAQGQAGNIEVRSRFVAQGYYNQPDEESRKFRDGWCLTGDAGFVDEDGYLHVLGRASDVAVNNNVDTGPTEIEDIFCRLPDVRYAAVFAPKNTSAGYTWIALLEPWKRKQVDVARCARTLEWALGTVISDRVHIIAVDRVPQTAQGKVDRAAIETLLLAGDDVHGQAPLSLR